MKTAKFLIAVFCLMVFVMAGEASAATVTINPDKTISIDGKKTFVLSVYDLCNLDYDGKYVGGVYQDTCSESLSKMSNIDFNEGSFGWPGTSDSDISYMNKVVPMFEQNNAYFTLRSNRYGTPQYAIYRDNSHFFGYDIKGEQIKDEEIPGLIDLYNRIRKADPNHPVITYDFRYMASRARWADIIVFEGYSHKLDGRYAPGDPNNYDIKDWLFAMEDGAWNAFIRPGCSGCDSVDDVGNGKTVMFGSWTNDRVYPEGSNTFIPHTAQELRAEAYTAITMGFHGIEWDVYKFGLIMNPPQSYGFGTNLTIVNAINNLAGELKSIENILVLPTKNHSWGGYYLDNRVTFSNNPTKNIWWKDRPYLNYMLKQDGNTYYLIVVNKADQSVKDNTVTISGLTGSMTARTIGTLGTGSSRAGRTISINNGKFLEPKIDGYAVHIYQICSGTCPELPTNPIDTNPPLTTQLSLRAQDIITYQICGDIV